MSSDKEKIEVDKQIIKEAIQEWLDKQFAAFGKWSLVGILTMAMVGLFYLWLSAQGWHK